MCSDFRANERSIAPRREVDQPELDSNGQLIVSRGQPLTSLPASLWEIGRTVRIRLNTDKSTPKIRSLVKQFAEEWMTYANIKFQFVGPGEAAEIRVSFDPGGTWSFIGRQALGVPFDFATMNYGWLDDSTSTDEIRRVSLHEFGHALGLVHEHQSSTSPIQWDKEKTYAYYKAVNGWSPNQIDTDIINRYQATETNYSPFDPLSIMNYAVDPSLTLDGKGIPSNTTLSEVDKKWIRLWYPFPRDSEGVIRTNDDCDEIEFKVENGLVAADKFMVVLKFGTKVTWWKAVGIPVGNSVQVAQGEGSPLAIIQMEAAQLDSSRPIKFGKAKGLGQHVTLPFNWNAMPAFRGGMKLSLRWVRDHC